MPRPAREVRRRAGSPLPVVPVEDEPLYQVAYLSRSRLRPGPEARDALAVLLRTSRASNEAANITGALMLSGDRFAQVLEGPQARVTALLARIRLDPRHDDLRVVEAGRRPTRAFPGWGMAYVPSPDGGLPSYLVRLPEIADDLPDPTIEQGRVALAMLRYLVQG